MARQFELTAPRPRRDVLRCRSRDSGNSIALRDSRIAISGAGPVDIKATAIPRNA